MGTLRGETLIGAFRTPEGTFRTPEGTFRTGDGVFLWGEAVFLSCDLEMYTIRRFTQRMQDAVRVSDYQ